MNVYGSPALIFLRVVLLLDIILQQHLLSSSIVINNKQQIALFQKLTPKSSLMKFSSLGFEHRDVVMQPISVQYVTVSDTNWVCRGTTVNQN